MTRRAADAMQGLLSLIFVPAGDEKLIGSALRRPVRGVVLDLEDAIPPADKARARAGLAGDVARLRQGSARIGVRVNRPWTMMVPDLTAAVAAGVDLVMLPKIQSAAEIGVAAEILDELAPDGGPAILSQIETARGLTAMAEIAAARPDRQAALMLGPEDLALDLGVEPTPETMTPFARSLVVAARAGGLVAVGSPGSIAEINDMARYRAQIEAGKAMGFQSVVAIHPRQVEVIEDVYRVDPQALMRAERIVAGDAAHGGRPFMLDGEMVDAPVVARARALIAAAKGAAG